MTLPVGVTLNTNSLTDCFDEAIQLNYLKFLKKNFQDKLACSKKVSEYDQEIPQSHTADQPTAP